jgi:hypothetical protein
MAALPGRSSTATVTLVVVRVVLGLAIWTHTVSRAHVLGAHDELRNCVAAVGVGPVPDAAHLGRYCEL